MRDQPKTVVGPVHDVRGREFLDRIRAVRAAYLDARTRTEQAFADGDAATGERLLAEELLPRQIEYQRAWIEMVEYQRAVLAEAVDAARRCAAIAARPLAHPPPRLGRVNAALRSATRTPRR